MTVNGQRRFPMSDGTRPDDGYREVSLHPQEHPDPADLWDTAQSVVPGDVVSVAGVGRRKVHGTSGARIRTTKVESSGEHIIRVTVTTVITFQVGK